MHTLLIRTYPLATEIKRAVADLLSESSPADTVTRFHDNHRGTLCAQLPCRAQARKPGPHDHDISPLTHRAVYSTRIGGYSIFLILCGRVRRFFRRSFD
jgi:hypothetical protein